jgi:hypothetical protein
MLRKFAAAMLATALIAGPALAASPADNAGSTPAIATAPASTTVNKPAINKPMAKPASKMVKHFRRHVVRHKVGKIKVAHHFKSTKTPRHHLALRPVKHAKFSKAGKVNKTNKINKTSKVIRTNKSTHS